MGQLELVDGLGLGEHGGVIIINRGGGGYKGIIVVVGGILYLAEYPALDHIKILKKAWFKEKDNKNFKWDPQTIGISYFS